MAASAPRTRAEALGLRARFERLGSRPQSLRATTSAETSFNLHIREALERFSNRPPTVLSSLPRLANPCAQGFCKARGLLQWLLQLPVVKQSEPRFTLNLRSKQGAPRRTRTVNQWIKSPLLCH